MENLFWDFRCAQCFQPFPDGIYFEFEGRKYCEHDFHVLYAPCCNKCSQFRVFMRVKLKNWRCKSAEKTQNSQYLRKKFEVILRGIYHKNVKLYFLDEFIIGRVIKAMNANWHPECFTCELCNKQLADVGFLRNAGRFNEKSLTYS